MSIYGINPRDFNLVAWREVERIGEWVKMKRGTGETGWWHDHGDGNAGWHPVDHGACRDCGKVMPADAGGGEE